MFLFFGVLVIDVSNYLWDLFESWLIFFEGYCIYLVGDVDE